MNLMDKEFIMIRLRFKTQNGSGSRNCQSFFFKCAIELSAPLISVYYKRHLDSSGIEPEFINKMASESKMVDLNS